MTMEEIRAAGIEAIEQRALDLEAQIPGADQEALTRMTDELTALEARKAELRAEAEARAKLAKQVTNGAGKVKKTFEEERTMSYGIESPEYRSAWLKSLQHNPLNEEERAALANGNYAIPTETLNKIIGKLELYPLLNAVDVLRIPGFVEIPTEGTVNDANVVAMANASTDSADSLGHVSLAAYKIIKTIEITADVNAMAIPAFESWLVDRLANKMYRKCTELIAKGTGTNEPAGLATIDATGQTYTKAAITFTDLLTIIGTLPTRYLPNAAFVMSKETFWQNVMAVKDLQENPIVVADRQAPAKYNVMGFPVIIEDEIGTDIIFGDLKEGYVWNFAKQIEVSRDESVGFRSASVCFRGLCLADGKPTGFGLVRFTKAA